MTPIIRIGDILIVTALEAIGDTAAVELQERIGEQIEQTGARALIIDITILDVVDSFLGRMLNDIAMMARLMGAATVVVGIQPAVAITLVELGLELKGIRTALNVEQALRLIQAGASNGGHGA